MFGLLSRIKPGPTGELGEAVGVPPSVPRAQTKAPGWALLSSFAFTAVYTETEGVSIPENKGKTQNVKRATVFRASETAIFFTATLSGKVPLDAHQKSPSARDWGALLLSRGAWGYGEEMGPVLQTKLTYIWVFLGIGIKQTAI